MHIPTFLEPWLTRKAILRGAASVACALAISPAATSFGQVGCADCPQNFGQPYYGNGAPNGGDIMIAPGTSNVPTPAIDPGGSNPGISDPSIGSGIDTGNDLGMSPDLNAGDTGPAPQFDAQSFTSSTNTSSSSNSVAPNMIGDFFGGGIVVGDALSFFDPLQPGLNEGLDGVTVPLAGGDRLRKVTEFNSAIPVDRFIFTYNHFHNAALAPNNQEVDVDRFVLGVEKTFGNGLGSVEFRVPMLVGLENQQQAGTVDDAAELGNLSLGFKVVLMQLENGLISAGTYVSLPTAEDVIVSGGADRIVVENEAVHLTPFIGIYLEPHTNWFFQGFIQADVDTNGNRFSATTSGAQVGSGVLQEQTLFFVDASIGHWCYRSNTGLIRGIAPTAELHYSTTVENADNQVNSFGETFIRARDSRIDQLNATGGIVVLLPGGSSLTVAAVTPLRTKNDNDFDAEIAVQLNCLY